MTALSVASRRWGGIVVVILIVISVFGTTREVNRWARLGDGSQRVTERLLARVQAVPPGSLVIVSAPAEFWTWALPYAIEPPFVPAVPERVHLLWHQAVDCCRGVHWLSRMQNATHQWTRGGAPVAVFAWDEDSRDFARVAAFEHRLFTAAAAEAAAMTSPDQFEQWLERYAAP